MQKPVIYNFEKKSKINYSNHSNHYFESNWNNTKNTWKVIKSILTIKGISADTPKSVSVDGSTVSNPMAIWNVFNYYFSSITSNTKLKIFPFRMNIFSNYLINKSNVPFFLSPTDKVVILNAISSLDPNISVGPNIILIKILKLLKNDITSQLTNIFNLPFFSSFL